MKTKKHVHMCTGMDVANSLHICTEAIEQTIVSRQILVTDDDRVYTCTELVDVELSRNKKFDHD